jgi:hypothetical protein
VDGEWTRDGLGMDWRWTGQGVEGLEVESTRTPWTTGGLHRDSTRISGGVINTVQCVRVFDPKGGNLRSVCYGDVISILNMDRY